MKKIECPHCSSPISEINSLLAYSEISGINDDGNLEFDGLSNIDYDSSTGISRFPIYGCDNCGKIFDNLDPFHEIESTLSNSTVMSDYDMAWHCPKCDPKMLDYSIHSYEDLAAHGKPVCSVCKTKMKRIGHFDWQKISPQTLKKMTKKITKKQKDKLAKEEHEIMTEIIAEKLVKEA